MSGKLFAIAAALALGSVPAARAAPGEIILHIDAQGTVPPDLIVVSTSLSGQGATRDEAMAAIEARKAAVLAEISALGIEAASSELSDIYVSDQMGMCGVDEACVDAAAAVDAAAIAAASEIEPVEVAPASSKKKKKKNKREEGEGLASASPISVYAEAILQVEVPFGAMDRIKETDLATGSGAALIGGKSMPLRYRDPAAARAAARDNAIANARVEADAFAAALGYKVVRIAGVSNAPAPFSAVDLVAFFTKFDGPRRDPVFLFSEKAHVGIDFVIAPR